MHSLDNSTGLSERMKVLPVKLRPRVGAVVALHTQSPPHAPSRSVWMEDQLIVPRTAVPRYEMI